jgi:hypothetical protein
MRAVRVPVVVGALAGCLAVAAPAASAATAPALRLGYLASIRASWTIAVSDCPSCSQPQRSSGTFAAGVGRPALRRRASGLAVLLTGARRRSLLRCEGPDLSARPLPPAPRTLTLLATVRGLRVRFAWALPACDPDIDGPVANADLPAITLRRAYLRRDTAYIPLRGRRHYDVAPDAAMPGPDLGPPPGHWTGTLTWSLTAKLTRCATIGGHRRCAF